MTKQEMARFARRKARIKALLAKGLTQAEIGRRIGLKRQRVCQIVNGK